MIGGLDRGKPVRVDVLPGAVRRKALIVTGSLPGHDAGFAKSGHAHYLQSFIDHFIERGFDTVLVVHTPRLDVPALRASTLGYRIAGTAFKQVGDWLILTDPAALRSALTWIVYASLPRPFQAVGAVVRGAVRKARGYVHVLGTFIAESDLDFVRRTAAQERPDLIVFDGVFNVGARLGDADHWVLTHEVKYERAESFHDRGVTVLPAGFSREAERAILDGVGNVIAIQWDDAKEFRRLNPAARVVTVPVTMDLPARPDRSVAVTGRCLFVGSGSFHNFDGIRWFLADCWPAIRVAVPHATLDIFGTVCYRLGDVPAGVTAHGTAADLGAAYAQASVAIVPLRIGSGLKVKLIEALAYGMPVVTTTVGAQGLSSFAPRPFLSADEAPDFAAECVRLLTTPPLARGLASAALACAEQFTPQRAFADFVAATAPAAPRAPLLPPRVCVAIPTFRRVGLLAKLLAGIAAQTVDATTAQIDVVVLDNDPAASAKPLVDACRAGFPYPLHYEHVREAGLSTVRNRALAFAQTRFAYIAMIDDDEVPESWWLAELLRVAHSSRAPVVVGPVFPIVPPGAPSWIVDLRAKETPVRADGALLRDGWSCNALVALDAVAARGISFDSALNFAGGEDQLFFRQMLAAGATIAFAAGATVRESIGRERLTLRFNLLRAFRRGNSLSFCERRMDRRRRARVIRGVKALRILALGVLNIPLSLRRGGEAALVLAACDVANGLGMLAGLAGKVYQAYGREQ